MSEIVTKIEDSQQDNEHYKYTKSIRLNPLDAGGEAVEFNIHVFGNEDGTEWTRGELVTSCYGAHVTSIDFRLDVSNLIDLLQNYQETGKFNSKETAVEEAQKEANEKQTHYVVYPEPNLPGPGPNSWDYMNEEKWHREGHGEHFDLDEIEVVKPRLFSEEEIKSLSTESRMIQRAKKKAQLNNNTYVVHPDGSDRYDFTRRKDWEYKGDVDIENITIVYPNGAELNPKRKNQIFANLK